MNPEIQARYLHTLAAIAIASILILASGCQAVTRQVVGTERADVESFAQKTVEVLSVQDIELRDNRLIYLRAFAEDPSFVALDSMQEQMALTDVFRDRVVSYSINLVRVTEFNATEAEMIEAYAVTLERDLRDQVINTLQFSQQEWTAVVADVRSQTKFLGALRAVQPVIDRASDYFEDLLNKIEGDTLVQVRAGFDERIQVEFAEPIAFIDEYYRVRDEYMAALRLLHAYRRGDEGALDELRARKDTIYSSRIPDGKLSEEQFAKLDNDLADWITTAGAIRKEFESDIANYEKARAELDQIEAAVIADLGIARLQFATWARSHQALANGVRDPAKWMDLTLKAAGAVKGAL